MREQQGAAEHAIAAAICNGLFDGKRVLWLVSGGSNVSIEKNIMDMLRIHADGRLGGLAILPIDERYGPVKHSDSNVEQLRKAGFNNDKATLIDVLARDLPFDETVGFYSDIATTVLANADVIIGQFGMGPDGHVAGIKPQSPATEPDESTVTGYTWSDYNRMTLMPSALGQVTDGFLIAYGADKKPMLAALKKRQSTYTKLPAMLLYDLPNVTVFNDQMGTRIKV